MLSIVRSLGTVGSILASEIQPDPQDVSPAEWGQRYSTGFIPWDVGAPHPELVARVGEPPFDQPGTALVPGSGLGHDAVALARVGWRVTAVDFVEEISSEVQARLEPYSGRFLSADALRIQAETPFDLVFDHTFFCAIHPNRRPEYGELIRRVLGPGGHLAAIVFPVGKGLASGGPPWDMSSDDIAHAVGSDFTIEVDEPVGHRVARRSWEERWLLLKESSGA